MKTNPNDKLLAKIAKVKNRIEKEIDKSDKRSLKNFRHESSFKEGLEKALAICEKELR